MSRRRTVWEVARLFGFDVGALRRVRPTYHELRLVLREKEAFARLAAAAGETSGYELGRFYPILGERDAPAGVGGGQYFHQDLFVAQKIATAEPLIHVDFGGRLDGFVAHVASFRQIYYVDIRPLPEPIPNVTDIRADITSDWFAESIGRGRIPRSTSVSFLHTLEHIGLGRYGDEVDPGGHLKALENVSRVVRPGGTLYLSTPIGHPRVEFNAHRVFHPVDIELILHDLGFVIDERALVDDDGRFERETGAGRLAEAVDGGLSYGLGLWVAIRER